MIYIGQSRKIEQRFALYRKLKCTEQPKLFNSLKKYGADKHSFEIIQLCTVEELDQLEIYYISLFNTIDNGMNLKAGGHKGGVWSEESKQKLSASLLLVAQDPAVKERRSAWQRGRKMGPEYSKKISQQRRGRIGYINQIVSATGNNHASKGAIVAFKDGIKVGEFKSTYDVERALGCQQQNVCKVISGDRPHTLGYTFKRIMRESYPATME